MFLTIYAAVLTTILGLPIAFILFKVVKRNTKPKETVLLKPDFERDTVYLIQFPVSPSSRTISPFSLKVESWLRLNNIKYENIHTLKFGPKGQIPYIELNGEQIPDSNVIIERLEEKFGVQRFAGEVTAEQRAAAHALTVMLENHTAIAGFHWRYGRNMDAFLEVAAKYYPQSGLKFWRLVQPYMTRFKTVMHGLGRHEYHEIDAFSCKDLKAVSEFLGEKTFLLGGTEPTLLDCTVFAHLSQFLYIPLPFPQKAFMKSECRNLVEYVDRVRDRIWPDWEEACKKEAMEPKIMEDS